MKITDQPIAFLRTALMGALVLSACTSSPPSRTGVAGQTGQGSGGNTGTAGGAAGNSSPGVGGGGTTGGAGQGAAGSAGAGAGVAGVTGGAGSAAGAGGGAAGAADAGAGTTGADAAAGTSGTSDGGVSSGSVMLSYMDCDTTAVPSPNAPGSNECDFQQQSFEFETDMGYPTTTLELTTWGKAFTAARIDNCHPYCFKRNLMLTVDMEGDADASKSRGEVVLDYPKDVIPLPTAFGRFLIIWVYMDGPDTMFQAQAVLRTVNNGVTAYAVGPSTTTPVTVVAKKWYEFRVPTLGNNDFGGAAMAMNVTGLGVRIWPKTPLTAGQTWKGRAYLDHMQISKR
jgi:hypothetical protein